MSNIELTQIPYDIRRAIVKMRERYYKIETLFWDPDQEHAVIRTWITEDANPREHILHRYGGSIYHKDVDAFLTPGFDVYRSNDTPSLPPRANRRRKVKRIKSDIKDIVQARGTTEFWMERRELQRELAALDYLFMREPTLAHAAGITELRTKMNTLDQRLAIMSEANNILGEEEE